MGALIFTGDLQELLPGRLAVRGVPGGQCAVCKTCKPLVLQGFMPSCWFHGWGRSSVG